MDGRVLFWDGVEPLTNTYESTDERGHTWLKSSTNHLNKYLVIVKPRCLNFLCCQ